MVDDMRFLILTILIDSVVVFNIIIRAILLVILLKFVIT